MLFLEPTGPREYPRIPETDTIPVSMALNQRSNQNPHHSGYTHDTICGNLQVTLIKYFNRDPYGP